MTHTRILPMIAVLLAGGAVEAAAPPAPDIFKSLLACRAISDSAARLSCYDGKVAALDSAAAKGDVAVIDRESVKKARKENFGRQNPKPLIPLGEKDIDEINVVVRTAMRNSDGGWYMIMTDGSRWTQTDSTLLGRQPIPGSRVHIKKGALGSFKLSVENGPAMKAKRIG